ncbi:MAG: hypothetical protein ACREI8_12080 [Myxococcota bacterium]
MKTGAFRAVAGLTGLLFVVSGGALFFAFFAYQQPGSEPALPMGPLGHYFAAFAGCALIGWGGALLSSARDLRTGRLLAPVTAFSLTLLALYRMLGWFMGDYYAWAGELLRYEAALFLLLALAFVWLRPSAAEGRLA